MLALLLGLLLLRRQRLLVMRTSCCCRQHCRLCSSDVCSFRFRLCCRIPGPNTAPLPHVQVYDAEGNYEQLESAMVQLDREMHTLGMSLYKLTQKRQLILIEYGFGGGTSGDGKQVAKTAEDVGRFSYFGIFGPYTRCAACGAGALAMQRAALLAAPAMRACLDHLPLVSLLPPPPCTANPSNTGTVASPSPPSCPPPPPVHFPLHLQPC
jgi:hypothetical protein